MKKKVYQIHDLVKKVRSWQEDGQSVVFTNGCFDLLHVGHVDYLEKSRMLGDKLVVGVNADASVNRLKGPERPLNDENSRSRILASLMFVDAVVIFEEDTPLQLIETLKPNVLVKGSDYHLGNIVGANSVLENGGKVLTVELVEGYSTSGLVNKIKKSN